MIDKTIIELADTITALRESGADVYIRWTCTVCGERVESREANSFHTEGYQHGTKLDGSACGHLFEGRVYGLRAAFRHPPL